MKKPLKEFGTEETPPSVSLSWEKEIYLLIYLVSFATIGLLLNGLLPSDIDKQTKENIAQFLIILCIATFLVGLFFAFRQLRWVNEQREKETSLGGISALFGFLITVLPALVFLLIDESLFAPITFLIFLGLLLVGIGLVAEVTRFDELLVLWLRTNLGNVIRGIGTVIGAFLLLVAIFLLTVDPTDLTINGTTIPNPLLITVSGLPGLLLLYSCWFSRVNRTVKATVAATVDAIRAIGRFFRDTIRSIYLAIVAFCYLLWMKRFTILRAIGTIIGVGLFLAAFLLRAIDQEAPAFEPFLAIPGLLFLYLSWFSQVNRTVNATIAAIVQSIQATGRFIRDTIVSMYLALVAFLWLLWANRIRIFRGIGTGIGAGLLLMAFLLLGTDPSVAVALVVVGLLLLYGSWFRGANLMVKKSMIVTAQSMRRTGHFLRVHYTTILRYSATIIGPIFLMIGFLGPQITLLSAISPLLIIAQVIIDALGYTLDTGGRILLIAAGVILLYCAWFSTVNRRIYATGYSLYMAIVAMGRFLWKKRIKILRWTGTTIASGFILLAIALLPLGVILFIGENQFAMLGFALLSGGIGLLFLYLSWLHKGNQLIKASIIAIGRGIRTAGRYLRETVRSIYLAIVAFGYLLWTKRIRILRSTGTIIGAGLFFAAFLLRAIDQDAPAFEPFLAVPGLIFLYLSWLTQVNRTAKASIIAIGQGIRAAYLAMVAFGYLLWKKRIEILRWTGTIIGYGFILLAILFLPMGVILIIGGKQSEMFVWSLLSGGTGLLFLYLSWFHQGNQLIKASIIAIGRGIQTAGRYLRETVHSIYLAIVAFGYLLWAKRIKIVRGAGTIIGAGLFFAAFLLRAIDQDAPAFEPFFAVPGLIFLYFSWHYQVNRRFKISVAAIGQGIRAIGRFFRETIHSIYLTLVAVYLAIVAFAHRLWANRITVLRGTGTIMGGELFLTALLLPVTLPNGVFFGLPVLEFAILVGALGVLFLYASWFHQVNLRVRNTFDAIVRKVQQFIHFVRDHFAEILRYSATIVSPFLILRGFWVIQTDSPLEGGLWIAAGVILLYAAWFNQVNQTVKATMIALWAARIAILRGIGTVVGALLILGAGLLSVLQPDVENLGETALLVGLLGLAFLYASWFHQINRQVVYLKRLAHAIRQFLANAYMQLKQLFFSALDSIVIIALLVLAGSAIFYGALVTVSGIRDPSGGLTRGIVDWPIINEIAEIIQFQTVGQNDPETLLGFFASEKEDVSLIQILGGLVFFIPGVILAMITFQRRQGLKLESFKGASPKSDPLSKKSTRVHKKGGSP